VEFGLKQFSPRSEEEGGREPYSLFACGGKMRIIVIDFFSFFFSFWFLFDFSIFIFFLFSFLFVIKI
jgi:hypothetical protein